MKGIEPNQGTGDVFFRAVVPNEITYQYPVDDPLYAAHRKVYDVLKGTNKTRYAPDYPLKVVSCVQQVSGAPDHWTNCLHY